MLKKHIVKRAELLLERYPEIIQNFENAYNIVENTHKKYPNQNRSLRYDFYLPFYNRYIEISPLYNKCEKIKKKIDEKKMLFECVVLTTEKEIIEYIKSLS
jgi:predicted nucleic acid-binding protein